MASGMRMDGHSIEVVHADVEDLHGLEQPVVGDLVEHDARPVAEANPVALLEPALHGFSSQ